MNNHTIFFKSLIFKSLIFFLFSCALHAGATLPQSYTLALTNNHHWSNSIDRKIELRLNERPVGYVSYTILYGQNASSQIHELHVNQVNRSKGGYGKMLLYSALNDILQAGSTRIELTRYPFNLASRDNFLMRDNQLKRWYRNFGFEESSGRTMVLTNPERIRNLEVISHFTDNGIVFDFRKKAG